MFAIYLPPPLVLLLVLTGDLDGEAFLMGVALTEALGAILKAKKRLEMVRSEFENYPNRYTGFGRISARRNDAMSG